ETDKREARRKQTAVGEVVDRGHELLARQIARDAEDDETRRAGDSVEAPVRRDAQGVVARADLDGHRAVRSRSFVPSPRTSPRVRVSTGRPWPASTLASPAAWAWMSWPKVN